ncbi:hypothetical protein L873DRAFT_1383145 [Choiromyces venosus 120613-1]|uniref:Integrase catalytic domain-containing protein n=1 Tax=Choiromyces venosus 120613-1 TaxID=1336337 RepID=A0A3N4J9K6_9PEZI|nr:hypothetical protein L873DRAFT_1383145 [Choiromyces venosus 120613-1]
MPLWTMWLTYSFNFCDAHTVLYGESWCHITGLYLSSSSAPKGMIEHGNIMTRYTRASFENMNSGRISSSNHPNSSSFHHPHESSRSIKPPFPLQLLHNHSKRQPLRGINPPDLLLLQIPFRLIMNMRFRRSTNRRVGTCM